MPLRRPHDIFGRPPYIGTSPVVNLGAAVAIYSSKHVFGRFDFGDLIVPYGPIAGYGTRHQFQGTAGFGLWF